MEQNITEMNNNNNLQKLKSEFSDLLKENQRESRGYKYTVPSPHLYPYQWLWDSCFHSIIYTRLGELGWAKDEIRSLIAGQWENGMLPHMIYWEKNEMHNVDWGTEKNTSSLTQPPMIAYAVERIWKASKDDDFVREVFPSLVRFYKWLRDERGEDELIRCVHPWETGEDDFVAWDSIYKVKEPSKKILENLKIDILDRFVKTELNSKEFLKMNIFSLKSLLFNSVYLRNLESMRLLANIISSPEEEYFQELLPKVREAFKKNLFNNQFKIYSSYYDRNVCIENIENSSIFLPLFANISSEEEAKELVEKYLKNEDKFWLRYPVPTSSADDENFQPNRYWRGSSWVNINWFIYKGLRCYGYDKVAQEVRDATIRMINKTGFWEYYNPINAKGLGAKNLTWSGLVFDMDNPD